MVHLPVLPGSFWKTSSASVSCIVAALAVVAGITPYAMAQRMRGASASVESFFARLPQACMRMPTRGVFTLLSFPAAHRGTAGRRCPLGSDKECDGAS